MTSGFRRIVPRLRRYRGAYIRGIAAAFLTSGFALAAPKILQHAIDRLGGGVTPGRLAAYSILLLAFALAGGWCRYEMRRLIIGASRQFEYDLRNDLFAHLQRLPASFFDRTATGDIMSRAVSDLEAVRLMAGIAIIDAVNTAVVFVAAVALMTLLDPVLTLVALAPLPFASLAVRYFGSAIHRRFQTAQVQLARVTALTQESLSGFRLVLAYGREEAETDRFRKETRAYLNRNRDVIRLQAIFYATMVLALGVGSVLVLWMGTRHVIAGRLTVGGLVAFMAYHLMLNLPMVAFGSVVNTVQRGLASWRRILDVIDEPAVLSVPARPAGLRLPLRGEVEIRNLTFGFGGRTVLDDVSLSLEPGQIGAVAGSTGSGKSTLLELLPRVYDPPGGTVFVDGIDVLDLPLEDLRSLIGFVPQEPFLFSQTVAENIAFGPLEIGRPERREVLAGGVDLRGTGAPHTTPDVMAAIRQAAAVANLEQDMQALPLGYGTVLGERGTGLSGGQRQRTALARALLIAPRILLLDDALSAADNRTEEEILERLTGEGARERTTILVSNRISALRRADVVFVLHEGRIVERGSHRQLMRLDGHYAALVRCQALSDGSSFRVAS